MKKFTFKTNKSTGRYRSFYSDTHDIKLNKKLIGHIDAKFPFAIRFMIIKSNINEDKNPNCKWKWILLKQESNSLQEAKNWLNENTELIQKKYNLYLMED
jgi:hypothetical protein